MSKAQTYIDYGSQVLPFTADGAISKYQAVYLSAEGKVKVPATTTVTPPIIGVALEDAADGKQVSVAKMGAVVPMLAASAITVGDRVVLTGTTGRIASAALTTTPGTWSPGYALETVTANGNRVAVLIAPEVVGRSNITTFTADGATVAGKIAIVGTADNKAKVAGADPTSAVIGVFLDAVADGAAVRVVTGGIAAIIGISGTINRGNPVTSAAAGAAKASAPVAGTNASCVGTGIATQTTGLDTFVLVQPFIMQG